MEIDVYEGDGDGVLVGTGTFGIRSLPADRKVQLMRKFSSRPCLTGAWFVVSGLCV